MSTLLTLAADSALTVLVPLLDEVPEADDVTPGVFYFLVFVGLLAMTILLWFSMRKHLKRIRFDEEPPAAEQDGAPTARETRD